MKNNYMKEHNEYNEETILHKRELFQKEKYCTLDKGMYIGGKIEKFKEVLLFDGKVQIMLPVSFGIMPEEYARVKYPSDFRPQILFTKADLSVNIGFTFFEQNASEKELEGMAAHIRNFLKRSNPSIQFYTEQVEYTANCKKVWYDFRTQALDQAIYNIHFLTIIDKGIMQGIFNCLYRETDDWCYMAEQIIKSVKDMTL